MKDFKINRNSWHYRLNKRFLNENGLSQYTMERYWEPKVNNFCTYWRVTMLRLFVASILALVCAAIALGFALGFVLAVINNPIGVAVSVGFAISIFAVPIGAVLIYSASSNRLKNSNSLFITKMRSVKNKFCPGVHYEE